MHTDQDSTDPRADGANEGAEDTHEENMSWLLDLDSSEPEEKLFAVDSDEYLEEGLSEYETELAGRPLTSGNRAGDDISMLVAEEIVVSSDGNNGGIYHGRDTASNGANGHESSPAIAKAIDHSMRARQDGDVAGSLVEDGSDILELADDDDMGEKFFSIKRVKAGPDKSEAASVQSAAQDSAPQIPVETPVDTLALADESVPVNEVKAVDTQCSSVDAVVEQPQAAEDSASSETTGWLEDEAPILDNLIPGDDPISLDAEKETGDVDLDLSAIAADLDGGDGDIELELLATGLQDETASLEMNADGDADDWLADVGLELVAPGEEEEPELAQAVDDDWLGDVALELADPGSDELLAGELKAVAGEELLEEADLEVPGSGTSDVMLVELETALTDGDDWLSESEMDMTDFGAIEDNAALDSGPAKDDDWLGDLDMDLDTLDAEGNDAAPGDSPDGMEVPADGAQGLRIGQDDSGRSVYLSEAPVTSQVADPRNDDVANEQPEPENDSLVASAGEPAGDNVQEYVALNQAPLDDEGFDDYLLRGAQLLSGAVDPEDLRVERTEGIVSVDPTPDSPIDYHDDFRTMDGFESAVVGTITPVISALVEEVASLANARLAELGQVGDTVEVDVMLATDPSSVAQCLADGYQPVTVICRDLPAALGQLEEEAVDLIHVRLFDGQTNENRNDLFNPVEQVVEGGEDAVSGEEASSSDLTPEEADVAAEADLSGFIGEDPVMDDLVADMLTDAIPAESVEHDAGADITDLGGEGVEEAGLASLETATKTLLTDEFGEEGLDEEWLSADSLLEETAIDEALSGGDVFGDDLFDEDAIDAAFAANPAGDPGSGDIDALFDDLEQGSDEAAGEQPDDLPVLETDALEEPAPADETALVGDAGSTEDDPGFAGDAGFGEDIFSTELSGEFQDFAGEDAADIDSVFAGLAMGSADTDEICGLDVHEFDQADDLEVMEAVVEFGETVTTASTVTDDADMSWCVPEGISFNYTSASSNEVFSDFLDAFIEEGTATVEKLEDAIGEWERDVTSEAAFTPVMRLLHTLKGIAKGVGLQRYGTLIHNFETLLESLPRPESGAEVEYFRIVNAWLDASVRGLESIRENRADIVSELPGQRTRSAAAEKAPADESVAAVEPENPMGGPQQRVADRQKKRDQQLADEGAKALAAQQSVRITSEKLDHLLNLTNQAQQLGVRSAQSTTRSKRASSELQGRLSSVRTHIGKIADRALLNVTATGGQQLSSELDALEMDQYSELQEAANILSEAVEDLADLVDVSNRHNAVLEALLKQQATVISTIGSSIQAARVVPVSRLMPGLRRIVRTVSSDLDKTVAFKVQNETGALDRDHYARCQVVLEHMVRNALDHGIESPEERLAVGKATTGRIAIDVRKSGGDYFITLEDDGRGIDPYEMRESAFRKGLDVDVDALSDEEAINLIFHKGFSTAAAVSEISGRGVGMDIVVSELQQIGGDVKVHSTVGQGTTFEVHIPAHVTVNGALFVTAGQSAYAVPLNGLIAVEHVPVDDFFNAVERGSTLPLFDMDCEPAYLATLCQGESLPDREFWGGSVPVIIAGSDKRFMAIAIDNLEEALELVIRSLGPQFANVPGVAGAATTADGEAVVALDLNLLVASVSAGSLSPLSVDSSKANTMLALVVDDSRTQRMVTTSQFDTVGVETVTAENGLVAIDLLNTTHRLPDVVLLDVEMPVKDGIETLREIRKSVRYKHLPVIMVTSRTGAKHRALAEEAGCDGYMGKPFNFEGLIKQINQLTGYDLTVS